MLKKLAIAAIIFTAGEVAGYANVNREARRRAIDTASPVFVLPPSKFRHYLWVDLADDPSESRSIKRNL